MDGGDLHDSEVDRLVSEYHAALKRGESRDQESWIADHPHLADKLRAALAEKTADVGAERPDPHAATLPPKRELHADIERTAAMVSLATEGGGDGSRKPTVAKSHAPSTLFGDYELVEEIARGGMGVVYKARQQSLNRIVALKMILGGQLAGESDVKRFYSEAEAAANLNHPNIVPIFEVGEHGGQHYFSMGYVAGDSLADRVKDGPLPPNEAASLVRTVAEAIQYAHIRGVIHRDLKPANVLLEEKDDSGIAKAEGSAPHRTEQTTSSFSLPPSSFPKVTDFGLAKRREDDSGLTTSGQILGTPAYMPPEQAAGKLDEINETSDVYSLGAILYCLLVGRPPFQAASVMDTLRQVLDQDPVPPRQLNARIPRDLETITLKALQKEQDRRYTSAAELAEDLRRYLEGEPIMARPLGRLGTLARWCRRNPVVTALIASVAALLIAGTTISATLAFTADREARRAVIARNDALDARNIAQDAQAEAESHAYVGDISAAQKAWHDGDISLLAERLDRQIPARGEADRRGFEWHYLSTLRESHSFSFAPDERFQCVAFSPDGNAIATGGARGEVNLIDVADSSVVSLGEHEAGVSAVAITSDGDAIVSFGNDGMVLVHSFEGEERVRKQLTDEPVLEAAFSLHSVQLALATSNGEIEVWNVETSPLTRRFQSRVGTGPIVSLALSPDAERVAVATAKNVVIYNVNDPSARFEIALPRGETISRAAFTSDGRWAAVAGEKDAVAFFVDRSPPVEAPLEPAIVLHPGEAITDLSLRPVAAGAAGKTHIELLAVGLAGGNAKIWALTLREDSIPNAQDRLVLRGHEQPIRAVTLSKMGDLLATAANDGGVRLWSAQTGKPVRAFRPEHSELGGLSGQCYFADYHPDGKTLAAAYTDGTIGLWNTAELTRRATIKAHDGWIFVTRFSASGERFLSAGEDGRVRVWHFAELTDSLRPGDSADEGDHVYEGAPIAEWNLAEIAPGAQVWDAAFLPDENSLVAADNLGNLWRLREGEAKPTPHKAHDGGIWGAALTQDGSAVATVSGEQLDGELRLWRLKKHEQLAQSPFAPPSVGLTAVAFSPHGENLVATAGKDAIIRLWDYETGRLRREIKGHTGVIFRIAFSPDGKTLASASYDTTVKLWHVATGRELITLQGHQAAVFSAKFSPDGRTLVTTSQDGSVFLWPRR